ncbi:hypothetical protein [Terasakiella sp.]|uniref:hypothetical protein n=1 Tax=Terasakiella sp. TaxID=2034861 RepID=UPI003AA982CA
MTEITSPEELEKWLEEQDKQICVAIAARIALRVVPFLEEDAHQHGDILVLPSFYAISTSWLATTAAAYATTAAAYAATSIVYAATTTTSTAYAARATAAAASTAYAATTTTTATVAATVAARATAAAAARATAAAAAAISNVWREISYDVTFLEEGRTVDALMERPLFLGGMDLELKKRWQSMKETLLSLDENWQVWTNWYEDRLVGGPRPNGRLVLEALERERVLITDEDWKKGAAHVNALIAEMEKRYQVPEPEDLKQRPAIVETEVCEDGKLHRKNDENEITDADLQESLQEAWEAHKDHFEDLKSLSPGQNEPTLQRVLSAYEKAMGENYVDLKIIALGVHGQRLQELALRADDRFLENVASELSALAAAHALFIQQFPKWRRYHANSEPDPSGEQLDAALKFAKEIKGYDDIIDEDVIEPTLDLVEDVEESLFADPDAKPLLSKELLNVNANILAGLMRPCLKYVRDCAGAVRKGSLNGVEKGSEELVRRTISLGGLALILSQIAPDKFGWIKLVLDALKNAMK